MEKSDLIRQKSRMQAQMSENNQQIVALENELERLVISKNKIVEVIHESNRYKNKLLQLDMNPKQWQGTTKNKYENHLQGIEQSIQTYINSLDQVENSMKEQIKRIRSRISQCQSNIYFLQSNISNLNQAISAAKER